MSERPISFSDNTGQVTDSDGLTPMRRAFCDAFVGYVADPSAPKHFKKQAALDAGYSLTWAAGAASENLRDPSCMAYIGRHFQESAVKIGVDLSYVLFNAVLLYERSAALGHNQIALRALEMIGKHVNVNAFKPAETGAAGLLTMFGLDNLSTDEKRLFLALIDRASGTPGGVSGGAGPVDSAGRSEGSPPEA